jgi:hypothetical protein
MLPQIVIGICKNTEYIVATHVACTYEDFEYTIGEKVVLPPVKQVLLTPPEHMSSPRF